jgi:glycosyltransferase involved in cell wall biosynthesis
VKLLFVLQELPYPASNGHRQKVLSLLTHLAKNHDCDVLAMGTQADLSRCEPWLRDLARLRILGVFQPDLVRFLRMRQSIGLVLAHATQSSIRYKSSSLELAIDRAVQHTKYDVVHVDLISMAQYCARLTTAKRVLSLNDSLSLTMFGRFHNKFAPFMFRLRAMAHGVLQLRVDKKLFRMADAVHFVGANDANWFRRRLGAPNAVYIPLAVNSDWLRVVPSSNSQRNHTLVIVEKLWADQHKNAVEQFLANHWLPLRRKYPQLRLVLIGGKGMAQSFRTFVGRLPGIELYEWVDRLDDVLADASIAVFPYSVPVGMKTRVLQCMAAMNTVVGTRDAFSGVPIASGRDAVVASSHAQMATVIDSLLTDPDRCRQIGTNARRTLQDHFTADVIGAGWEELYRDIAAGVPVRSSYGLPGDGVDT